MQHLLTRYAVSSYEGRLKGNYIAVLFGVKLGEGQAGMSPYRLGLTCLVLAVLIQGSACAPSNPASPSAGSQGAPKSTQGSAPRGPKTLTVVVLGEPTTFGEIGVSVATAGG